jgi:hypothetical protein
MTESFPIGVNLEALGERIVKLRRVEAAARALFDAEWPDLIANYDTGRGDPAGDFAAENPKDAARWQELKAALDDG